MDLMSSHGVTQRRVGSIRTYGLVWGLPNVAVVVGLLFAAPRPTTSPWEASLFWASMTFHRAVALAALISTWTAGAAGPVVDL